MMKILYDITILGRSHEIIATRTGIYRVVESVAEELLHQPECNIFFCANEGWTDVGLSKSYLKNNPAFTNVPFSTPINYNKRNTIKKRMTALLDDHDGSWQNLPFLQKTAVRLENKQLELREKFLGRSTNQLIHPKDLAGADIYHSHFFASFKDVKEAGVKSLFLTSYDIIPLLYPQFCVEGMPELMISIFKKLTPEHWIVCISESTRNDLLNYLGNRIDPAKVKVTELAASAMFYQSTDKQANQLVRNSYGIPDTPYILSLCTLEPRKNIDQAIKAFVQIVQQQNIPNLNLVLVGAKGWKFEKIFDTINATDEVKRRIFITGYVPDEDLSAIYSDAIMFVYPSFYEGFGLPPLEAMQCGVPVITSNTSSLPEVIGDAGIMITPEDTDALCQAMWQLYTQPALRQQFSDKSIKRAAGFSWKRCAEETMNAYKLSLK